MFFKQKVDIREFNFSYGQLESLDELDTDQAWVSVQFYKKPTLKEQELVAERLRKHRCEHGHI